MQQVQQAGIEVVAVYVNACCQKNIQLSLDAPIFQDWGIKSVERFCQVIKTQSKEV